MIVAGRVRRRPQSQGLPHLVHVPIKVLSQRGLHVFGKLEHENADDAPSGPALAAGVVCSVVGRIVSLSQQDGGIRDRDPRVDRRRILHAVLRSRCGKKRVRALSALVLLISAAYPNLLAPEDLLTLVRG